MFKNKKMMISWITTKNNPHSLQSVILFIFLIIFTVTISFGDYFSGRYVTVFSLYIFPVMLATWKIGLKTAVFFCVIVGLLGLITEHYLKPNAELPLLFTTALTRMFTLFLLAYGGYKIQLLTKHLETASERDFLTGALNRRGFFLQGQIELERMIRTNQSISLMYIDIDNFKEINDLMGHDIGDTILRKVATTIKSNIRKIDIFARLGGDEFAILLPSANNKNAMRIAKKLFMLIQNTKHINNIYVEVSVGVASFTTPPTSIHYALKCADNLMYKVKKSNKNAILQDEF